MKNTKESDLLYSESGSREDIDIYLQRIEELERKQSSSLFIKLSLAFLITITIGVIAITYNKL